MAPNLKIEDRLPTQTSTKTLFKEGSKSLREDNLKTHDGKEFSYVSFVSAKFSAMVLAKTEKDLFVINKEYRYPSKEIIYSLPGGTVEEGEDPQLGAKREFLEESGYEATNYQFLGKSYPFPGSHSCLAHFYLADHAKKVSEPKLDVCEVIETVELGLDEINELILQGAHVDGHLVCALYLLNLTQKN